MADNRQRDAWVAGSVLAAWALYLVFKHIKQSRSLPPSNPSVPSAIPQSFVASFARSLIRNSTTREQQYLSASHTAQLQAPDSISKDSEVCLINPMLGEGQERGISSSGFMPISVFNTVGGYVLSKQVFREGEKPEDAVRFVRGVPRDEIAFDPKTVKAAIATCGGLCPGLNVVIRELVMTLHYNYGVRGIFGIQSGYRGFYTPNSIIQLTPEKVTDVHNLGGTLLKSSRGGFDLKAICDSIESQGFNMLFILGGDGTHRGIMVLSTELRRRNRQVAIVGVPKTIDNDIPLIDKSFGFETAVQEAQRAIQSANVEANSADFGVGLVRLMGRNSGFVAMNATIASRDVNLCLIPEVPYEIKRVVEFVYKRLVARNHCVIVVAEGAATACVDQNLVREGKDPSGNPLLFDIGAHLKKEIVSYCASKGMECILKFIDPTYMIRTVPANSHDRTLCVQLAQAAVHGAFAGYTAFTVGTIAGKSVLIPVQVITQAKEGKDAMPGQRRVDPEHDIMWWRLMASTGQPNFTTPSA